MGVTFDYATTTPVGDATREAILAECELARQSRDWWCEAIWFSDSKRQGGRLVGWNKLLLGGYTAADGSYISIEEDDADDLMEQFRQGAGWDIQAPIDESRARKLSKKYASRKE